jgi:hypothetical protein
MVDCFGNPILFLICTSTFSSVHLLLLTANVHSSPILVTLMMEALRSSETSVLTRATRRNIPEDGILHSHRHENVKSYIALTGWTLYWLRNVSPVRYELGSYISEDILHPISSMLKQGHHLMLSVLHIPHT